MRPWGLVGTIEYSKMLGELIYAVKCRLETIRRHRAAPNIPLKLLKPILRYVVDHLMGSAILNWTPIVLYLRLYCYSHMNYYPKVCV